LIKGLMERLFAALLGAFAGIGVYLWIVNRALSYLRDGAFKSIFLSSSLAILVGGFGALGFTTGLSVWMLLPVALLFAMGVSEARLLLGRWKVKGSPPLTRSGKRLSLLRPVTTTDLQVLRYRVRTTKWPGALRVAHLSDLHVTERIPLAYYQQVMERVSQEQADLVFITGDFVTELRYLALLPDLLGRLHGRLGVYAILGNHDYWADASQVAEVVQASGIHLLRDGWQRLAVAGQKDILLLGCEAPWSGKPCNPPALTQDDFALALSHSADNIFWLARAGATSVFCGHYHAGQFQVPGLGPLVIPSAYGRRYYQGHFMIAGAHLFVTAGVGAARPPFRLYCPPDVLVVDFEGAESQEC
jgi:hypothetical protein